MKNIAVNDLKEDIKDIKVVPNPYVGTNAMEEAVMIPLVAKKNYVYQSSF